MSIFIRNFAVAKTHRRITNQNLYAYYALFATFITRWHRRVGCLPVYDKCLCPVVFESRQIPGQHHHTLSGGLWKRTFSYALEPDYSRERVEMGVDRGKCPWTVQLGVRQLLQLCQTAQLPLQVPLSHLGRTVSQLAQQPFTRTAVRGYRRVDGRREGTLSRPPTHRRGERGGGRSPAGTLQRGSRR